VRQAKVSTIHIAAVVGSYRPRVVGPSKIGGLKSCRTRSPTSSRPPGSIQRMRSSGRAGFSRASRSTLKKFVTSVAAGQRSSTSSRPPVWSPSSWERKIQRTSSGSTTEKTFSSHSMRCSGAPVSTMTGCCPRMTIELTGR